MQPLIAGRCGQRYGRFAPMLWALVLSLSGAFGPGGLSGQEETSGTYRVWLCPERCSVADSAGAILEATLVLFDENGTPAEEDWPESYRRLRLVGFSAPNACFRVTADRDAELFFGIVEKGVTAWGAGPEDGFHVQVYRSPDAAYQLRWDAAGAVTAGEGWQLGFELPFIWERNAFFAAQRLGPPKLEACS